MPLVGYWSAAASASTIPCPKNEVYPFLPKHRSAFVSGPEWLPVGGTSGLLCAAARRQRSPRRAPIGDDSP